MLTSAEYSSLWYSMCVLFFNLGALLVAAQKLGIDVETALSEWDRIQEMSFSSETKWMAVYCKPKKSSFFVDLFESFYKPINKEEDKAIPNNHQSEAGT